MFVCFFVFITRRKLFFAAFCNGGNKYHYCELQLYRGPMSSNPFFTSASQIPGVVTYHLINHLFGFFKHDMISFLHCLPASHTQHTKLTWTNCLIGWWVSLGKNSNKCPCNSCLLTVPNCTDQKMRASLNKAQDPSPHIEEPWPRRSTARIQSDYIFVRMCCISNCAVWLQTSLQWGKLLTKSS